MVRVGVETTVTSIWVDVTLALAPSVTRSSKDQIPPVVEDVATNV
jgi:hypothetical protein